MNSLVAYELSSTEDDSSADENEESMGKALESEISADDDDDLTNTLGAANKKRQMIMTSKKLEIIDYAEKFSNRAASRHFKIHRKSVREWRQMKSKTCKNEEILGYKDLIEIIKSPPSI